MSTAVTGSSWRLSYQVILALAGAAVIVGFLFGEAVRYFETERLKTELQSETQRTADLLGAVSIDALITEDGPLLETIIQQAVERVAEIQSIVVQNETGKEIARWPRDKPDTPGPSHKLVGDVSFQNELFGRMTVRWGVGAAEQEISNRVMWAWIYTTGLLACVTLVFFLLSNWLILRPLGRINDRVLSLASTEQSDALRLPASSAREFLVLAASVNTLSAVLTERAERQSALQKAKEAAEAADKSKSTFLAMMSHEIRTPLNGVLGILNLLRDTRLNDDQRELLKTARDSGKSLLTIINDILDYSKLEAGRMVFDREVFFVEELIHSLYELTRPLAESKHLRLSATLDDAVPLACFGDQGRIRQVLLNLASNAVKFTETGTIDIAVKADAADGEMADVTFSVTDTGVGVEEDKKHLIFSEFSSLEKEVSGDLGSTGLGLAISKFMVEAMGGRIGCESTRGSGSTFWFTVPLMQADFHEIRHDTGDAIVPSDGLQKLRILLAEDNATNQMVLTRMLEGMGCRVDVAANGLEAVEAASSRRYHTILMDIGMPEMDGVAAAHVIRGMEGPNRNIPIIALTAYAYLEECQHIKSADIDEVITKPVSQKELIAALEQIVASKDVALAETAQTHVLDRSVLDSLLKGRDPASKRQLIQQIFDDLQAQRSALSDAVANQDLDLLERASHTLEGLGGVFGACALSEQAHEANNHAKNPEGEAAWTSANSLVSDCDKVLEAVNKLLKCSPVTLDQIPIQSAGDGRPCAPLG